MIIPCYKQAHFLPDAIDGALKQTHQELEVVVVDDGSTDNTAAVVARYPRVKCVRQGNRGLAEARNAGFRASTGEYVLFLDADDRLTPNAVETHVSCFAKNPEAGFVVGDIDHISSDGSYLGSPRWPVLTANQYRELLKGNHVANTIAVMFRREVISKVGGFKNAFDAVADYELLLNAARQYSSAHHRDVVAHYRRHAEAMSRRGSMMLEAMDRLMQTQREFLTTPELRDAWEEGRAYWRDHFGAATIKEVIRHLRRFEVRKGLSAAYALAKFARWRAFMLPWKKRRQLIRMVRSR